MTNSIFIDLFQLGLKPIPIVWDEKNKNATSHTLAHSQLTPDNYTEKTFSDLVKDLSNANGIALKLFPPFGMIDFDLKNTDDKDLFEKWKFAVNSQNEDILGKICFETTRNNGFHVYLKYTKLKSKVSLARESNGEEVIALYTGGVLSYCDPTPGYNMIWNGFEDLQELTDDEFSILISTSEQFNKHRERDSAVYGEQMNDPGVVNGRVLVEYPTEYESTCLQFDLGVTDEVFEHMLNEMTLFEVKDYRYRKDDKFIAYLRKGSSASFSAKVYWKVRRVLLFTSSLPIYPSYMDRVGETDHSWVLTPSRLLYYKNDRDWSSTMDEITMICDSADIELVKHAPVTNLPVPDRLKFPMDIFPETIHRFISAQRIQNEYLAGGMLATLSICIGNTATLLASDGYEVKPILYMAIVAPPGASKTPALKTVFKPLFMIDDKSFDSYKEKYKQYKKDLMAYKNDVKKSPDIEEPAEPELKQLIIQDATIEKLISILSSNPDGCGLFSDELAGFLKRMNKYGSGGGDEIQKWLELWSGGGITVQRVSREIDKVSNPFCTIVGGIQPGVLQSLSSDDNEHNGFYHRFLFVYPEVQDKIDWSYHQVPQDISEAYQRFMFDMVDMRMRPWEYRLSDDANSLYKEWFDNKNIKYNKADSDNHKGIIAKYQDYCLRFALIIQRSHDCEDNILGGDVSANNMERAIRLTEYFFGNMNKAINILAPGTPKDVLTGKAKLLYESLPAVFKTATAAVTAESVGIKKASVRMYLHRWCNGKNAILKKTGEQRDVVYEKIF